MLEVILFFGQAIIMFVSVHIICEIFLPYD